MGGRFMIHRKNDILFTLMMLTVILSIGAFLRYKVISEVNRPPIRVDGNYENMTASQKSLKDADDYIDERDEEAVSKVDPVLSEAVRLKKEGYLDAAVSMLERVHRYDPANEEAMIRLVSAYIALEQFPKAEKMLLQMLELNPQNARAYYNLGVVKSRQGESADAVIAYTKALALNPVYTRAYYNLGLIHLKMGLWEKAEEHFRAITRYDHSAGSAKAHFQLGYVLSKQPGKIPGAIAAYRQAIVLKPDYVKARNNLAIQLEKIQLEKTDDADGAMAELEKSIQLDPSAAGSLYNLGRLYSDAGRLQEAANCYRSAAQADSSLTKAFFNLGVLEEKWEHRLNAIDAYESVLEAEPDHFLAMIRLGLLYQQINDLKKAEKYLKFALSIDPKYASAWDSLGILYASQGSYKKALKHYEEAVRLDPENVSAELNKAVALENLNQNKAASKVYYSILNRDARNIKARCRLVRLYARMGDFKKTKAQAIKLEKLFPRNRQALAAISAAYLSMDLPAEAVIRQKKIVELLPDDISARVTLGEIYDQLRRYTEAIDSYLAASKQIPDDVALLRAIAKAYENNADPNQAQVYFERVAEQEAVKSQSQSEKP
ncbi:MAG: hypothetical protein B6I25_08320 [Planctomycetales bacterium 4572_13]|nr:MAG: hypothetical protein B6I25_08320 [Planctomycetales bacterium 4572_13]